MMAKRLAGVLLVAVFGLSGPGQASTIATPSIVAQTTNAALACMQWLPIGTCFWLRCNLSGCDVRTSLKVGHYNPDLVVSTYNTLGENPWTEIRATLGLAQQAAATGLLGSLAAGARRQCGQSVRGQLWPSRSQESGLS